MIEFTKGKWKIDNSEAFRGHIYVLDASGVYHCIAHVAGMWNDEYSIQANANARLIAAAPELYELLNSMCSYINEVERIIPHFPNALSLFAKNGKELLARIDGKEVKNG